MGSCTEVNHGQLHRFNGRGAGDAPGPLSGAGFRGMVLLVTPAGARHLVWEGRLRRTDREALDDAVAELYRLEGEEADAVLNQVDEIAATFGFAPLGDWEISELAHPIEFAWPDDSQEGDITLTF